MSSLILLIIVSYPFIADAPIPDKRPLKLSVNRTVINNKKMYVFFVNSSLS